MYYDAKGQFNKRENLKRNDIGKIIKVSAMILLSHKCPDFKASPYNLCSIGEIKFGGL